MIVNIDHSGDLSISVTEYEQMASGTQATSRIPQTTVEFKISRAIMTESSLYFKKLLVTSDFAETKKNTITLQGDRVKSMEIWFKALHESSMEDTYNVSLDEVWHIVAAGHKYDLDITILQNWFAKWYELAPPRMGNEFPGPESLLYPCWIFDHASGFAKATKQLVYGNIRHIQEKNPTKHKELHLPPRIIQQLNAAKGRLRTVIHQGLFRPNERLLIAHCNCKEKTLFGYEKELYNHEVWPLERVTQTNSMDDILSRLDEFRYETPKSTCIYCNQNYLKIVSDAKQRTKKYFDGLCLDCLDESKPTMGHGDSVYWKYNNFKEEDWITGCRMGNHMQSTWYFSFMGRKEDMDLFRKKQQDGRVRLYHNRD